MTATKPKKSKAQEFKERFGFSKTMKKNMSKYGVTTVEEYRTIRKGRKKAEATLRKAKHAKALAGRKPKKVKAKGAKVASVVKV